MHEECLHPGRYRVEFCRHFRRTGRCTSAVCFFAHSPEELRVPDPVTQLRMDVLRVRFKALSGKRLNPVILKGLRSGIS